jgi:hypothetical protein
LLPDHTVNAGPSTLTDLSDLVLLRSIQKRIHWSGRDAIARVIAQTTAERMGGVNSRDGGEGVLAELCQRGICRAPLTVTPAVCESVRAFFRSTPCYAAHVPAYSKSAARSVEETASVSNYGSYRLDQSLVAPHILELALDPRLLELVGGYLGCLPTLYSINTFWTFPAADVGLTHSYHRDEDDYRFVVVFVYWTDVEVGEGEFYFIEGTHDREWVEHRIERSLWPLFYRLRGMRWVQNAEDLRRLNGGNGYGYDPVYRRLFGRYIRCFDGTAGTAIATDTFGLHRGAPPRERPRLCTWIRYGLYANEAYRIDKTEPIPASRLHSRISDDELTRHITRLVLDWKR